MRALPYAFRVAHATHMRVKVWDEEELEAAEIPGLNVRRVEAFVEHKQVDSIDGSSWPDNATKLVRLGKPAPCVQGFCPFGGGKGEHT